MNSVSEALNTLISAVNVAHNKGGVYSLEESHYIYLAISYLNSLQKQTSSEAPKTQSISETPKTLNSGAIMEDFEDGSEHGY